MILSFLATTFAFQIPQQLQGFQLVRLNYVNEQRLKCVFKPRRLYSDEWHLDYILCFFVCFA